MWLAGRGDSARGLERRYEVGGVGQPDIDQLELDGDELARVDYSIAVTTIFAGQGCARGRDRGTGDLVTVLNNECEVLI